MNARNLAEVTVDIGEEGTESVTPPPTYSIANIAARRERS